MTVKNNTFQYPVQKKRNFGKMWSVADAVSLFFSKHGEDYGVQLNALWEHWDVVMGEQISDIGFPLGHKKDTLLLGTEDSMAMQELTMMSEEIIDRANAFIDHSLFTRVKVRLLQEKKPLTQTKKFSVIKEIKKLPPPPSQFGKLRGNFDNSSPVAECYEAFYKMYFEEEK